MAKVAPRSRANKSDASTKVQPLKTEITSDLHLFEEVKKSSFAEERSDDLAEESEDAIDYAAENLKLDLAIRKEKKERRKKWDKTLLALVITGFTLSYLFILLIGVGVLEFNDSAFAVPAVVAAGIIQTYGLAKIAAQYFFSDDGSRKKPKKPRIGDS